jgi:SecD/SecF fusion protein
MQLKGLVRFFTILLIIYSVYQLSFTWFVKGHEKKMAANAKNFVQANYPDAQQKYPENKELQALYQDTLNQVYQDKLKRLLDSTRDVKITLGPQGWMTYQQAKENELNLGLDLQGGINVTMEVELSGLLRAMSNNSKNPQFQKALENATLRKANSNADYITLFVQEYKKLNPNGRLASLFATANQDKIKINDGDDKVIRALHQEANDAFDRTFRVLNTRIDQFGVSQPNINPDVERGIITVELPGVQDEQRVRKYLQSSANLQFWETYKPEELQASFANADREFDLYMRGVSDTAKPVVDTAAATQNDTTGDLKLSEELKGVTANKGDSSKKRSLSEFLQPGGGGAIFSVTANDTALVREFLNVPTIRNQFPADARFVYGMPSKLDGVESNIVPLYILKTYGNEKAPIEGETVVSARQDFEPTTGRPVVSMTMNPTGSRLWENITEKSAREKIPIAIVLDDLVYSAPIANEKISGGSSQISGNFTVDEAQDLANILKSGKLPAPAKIVQEQKVGPTLGADAVRGGSMAFLLSFLVIFLLMLIYYNTSGWIANIALILNLLFTVGVLTGLGATLTAPGIAGLVLTIGMAVDTNVIIYERIKEELTKGRTYVAAVNEGYKRSYAPVLDAHITTLLTAIILFYFGLGPVKGFATTQIIGILLSLFCGILVSRWVSEWFTNKKRHLEYFTKVSRKIFQHAAYRFIEMRKITYVISGFVILLGVGAIVNGFNYGVEFSGGRSYVIDFGKPVNVEQVRDDLKLAFGESPVIKTIGSASQLDITTSYLIEDTRENVDMQVQQKLFDGLKDVLPAGTSFNKFQTDYKLGSKTVLPTISDDLKKGALWATFWSLLVITLYIFMRFRDWRYSVGTIFSLLHDVLVILAVFSFFKNIVPFPLEIDQHFIAAILTVIGFSMNDTIIVFDRIREDSGLYPNMSKRDVINKAINQNLSRTIMTSLTVFLTILILFLVGGEVTRGFAFAMLIGVVTGIYSSIFVAAPILIDMAKDKPFGKADFMTKEKTKVKAKPAAIK